MDYFSSIVGPGSFDRKIFQNGAYIQGFGLSRDSNPHAQYYNSSFSAGNINIQGVFRLATGYGYTGM